MAGEAAVLGVVGPYRLHARLGVHGGVETYAARRHPSGEAVRVDRIDPRLTARRDDLARIVGAAGETVQLTHPNVVQLFELLQAQDAYYLVREQVAGRSLGLLLDQLERADGPRLPLWLSLHIVAEILAATIAVHARDVAHGSLDASLVILSDHGEVKVDDALMGVALQPAEPTWAPEGVISQQADVFAVGVILYRALTGRGPFEAGSHAASRARMRSDVRVPPSAYALSLPPQVDALVLNLIAADPEARPRGALPAFAEVMACAGHEGWTRTHGEVAQALARFTSIEPRPSATSCAPEGVIRPITARLRCASYAGRALSPDAFDYAVVPLAMRSS